jgi:hypothetical protein
VSAVSRGPPDIWPKEDQQHVNQTLPVAFPRLFFSWEAGAGGRDAFFPTIALNLKIMGALNPVQLLYLEKDNRQHPVRLFSTFSWPQRSTPFEKTKCFRLWLWLALPTPSFL